MKMSWKIRSGQYSPRRRKHFKFQYFKELFARIIYRRGEKLLTIPCFIDAAPVGGEDICTNLQSVNADHAFAILFVLCSLTRSCFSFRCFVVGFPLDRSIRFFNSSESLKVLSVVPLSLKCPERVSPPCQIIGLFNSDRKCWSRA